MDTHRHAPSAARFSTKRSAPPPVGERSATGSMVAVSPSTTTFALSRSKRLRWLAARSASLRRDA